MLTGPLTLAITISYGHDKKLKTEVFGLTRYRSRVYPNKVQKNQRKRMNPYGYGPPPGYYGPPPGYYGPPPNMMMYNQTGGGGPVRPINPYDKLPQDMSPDEEDAMAKLYGSREEQPMYKLRIRMDPVYYQLAQEIGDPEIFQYIQQAEQHVANSEFELASRMFRLIMRLLDAYRRKLQC